jgi:hypothetical protein
MNEQHAASKACPSCGSNRYKAVSSAFGFSLVSERECKDCGNRYTPPVSKAVALAAVVIGAVCFLAGPIAGAILYFQFADEFGGGFPGIMGAIACLAVALAGIGFFRLGLRELRRK